nr:hypothetical protein [Gammaproteobacteria bacterium]
VAQDGFTALGLSYQTGADYVAEQAHWLQTDLCLVRRLWPIRTVADEGDDAYFGPVGTLVRASNKKSFPCFVPAGAGATECVIEEINDATDVQMNLWVKQIEQLITDTVSDPVLNSRTIAWYMGPEELRGTSRELELLRRIYDAVQSLDPKGRPAWMYNPQHSDATRLIVLGPWMDALSVGIYPNISNTVNQRIHVRHALTQMSIANEQLDVWGPRKAMWPVLEMFESEAQPYSLEEAALVPDFVRHDYYAAFANGAEGVLVYSLGYRPGFWSYAQYYDAWVAVLGETTELGLGAVFRNGELQSTASAAVLDGDATLDFVAWNGLAEETYPSVSVRDWVFENSTYVLLVNSAQTPVTIALTGIPVGVYKDLFTNATYATQGGEIHLELPSLGVVMLSTEGAALTPP